MTQKQTSKLNNLNSKMKDNPFLVPVSIIVAGAFIALAVFFSGGAGSGTANVANNNNPAVGNNPPPEDSVNASEMAEVTSADHIRGNLDAKVKVIEYSDFSCPFCQRFHPTMQQVVDEYDGRVAWVYRHFPLDSIHPDANAQAQASECVAEQGGNDAFWLFTDALFEGDPVAPSQLASLAGSLGYNASAVQSCLDSEKYADKVAAHTEEAIATGGRGTPWSIVVAPNGETFPISGAQPFSALKATIDLALQAE